MSNEKPTVLLEHYLKELKLPTFLREYQKMAELCGKDHGYMPVVVEVLEADAYASWVATKTGSSE